MSHEGRVVLLAAICPRFPGSVTAGATLTAVGSTNLMISGSIPGPVDILDYTGAYADYTQFVLTTADGYTYNLDQTLGVTSLTDPNGNTLTISANGVVSSAGPSVAFTRDGQGRITRKPGTFSDIFVCRGSTGESNSR